MRCNSSPRSGPSRGIAVSRFWQASALLRSPNLLHDAAANEDFLDLPPALEGEEVSHDYESVGLTLSSYPMLLFRPVLDKGK